MTLDDLPQKMIPLGRHRARIEDQEKLVFDRVNGKYRVALYRRVEKKMQRDVATAATLYDAIAGAFNQVVLDGKARELFDYIRSTEWGCDL